MQFGSEPHYPIPLAAVEAPRYWKASAKELGPSRQMASHSLANIGAETHRHEAQRMAP